MVNSISIYMFFLDGLMKLTRVRRQAVELKPGTVLNFWVPSDRSKSKAKPAVVFLHGFGLNGILTWQFQVLALAKNYSVYVPDFLFFGGSTTDQKERSPEFQALCIAEGLRKLGVENCTLVGLSYGGMVGFKMAGMFPDLVESMVVTCSVMALTESVSSAGLNRIGFTSWAQYLIPDSIKGVKTLFEIGSYRLPWTPNFVYEDAFEVMFDNRKERIELLEALIVGDKDFQIPYFPQKIHLIWGENDKIFNMEEARSLKEQLEGKASLHCIEKAGHLVQLERPCVYNKHLKKILASLYEGKRQDL